MPIPFHCPHGVFEGSGVYQCTQCNAWPSTPQWIRDQQEESRKRVKEVAKIQREIDMPKDKASEAEWRKRFMLTKFGSGGGACFECSDYEAMYEDLLEFIRQQRKQAAEEIMGVMMGEMHNLCHFEAKRKGEEYLKTL